MQYAARLEENGDVVGGQPRVLDGGQPQRARHMSAAARDGHVTSSAWAWRSARGKSTGGDGVESKANVGAIAVVGTTSPVTEGRVGCSPVGGGVADGRR
jgi:hypothetical protein